LTHSALIHRGESRCPHYFRLAPHSGLSRDIGRCLDVPIGDFGVGTTILHGNPGHNTAWDRPRIVPHWRYNPPASCSDVRCTYFEPHDCACAPAQAKSGPAFSSRLQKTPQSQAWTLPSSCRARVVSISSRYPSILRSLRNLRSRRSCCVFRPMRDLHMG